MQRTVTPMCQICRPDEMQEAHTVVSLHGLGMAVCRGHVGAAYEKLADEIFQRGQRSMQQRAVSIADGFIDLFGEKALAHIPPHKHAKDVVMDIKDGINSLDIKPLSANP